VEDDPLRGKRGVGRLLAVLGWGELVMLVAAALGAISLVYYLSRALDGQPAVLTPGPTRTVSATRVGRGPSADDDRPAGLTVARAGR
jgi:hypothetical protein